MSEQDSAGGIGKLLTRHTDADTIADQPAWRIGVSMMSSYATGVSLMAGMGIIFGLGIVPGLLWLFLNGLSLGFWGLILKHYPHARNWFLTLPALGMAVLFAAFGPAFNLTALHELFVGDPLAGNVEGMSLISHELGVIALTVGAALIITYIYKYGIRGSLVTDMYQFYLQFIGIFALIGVGLFLQVQGIDNRTITGVGLNEMDTMWVAILAIWPTLISPFLMSMEWQRWQATPEEKQLPAALFATFLFTLYMFAVGIAAFLWQPHWTMLIPAALVVLAVGTSSLDSAVSLHQYVMQRFFGKALGYKIGTGLSIVALLSWAGAMTVLTFGIGDLWLFVAEIMGPYFLIGMAITTVWLIFNKIAPGAADSIRTFGHNKWWFRENVYYPERDKDTAKGGVLGERILGKSPVELDDTDE